MIRKSKPSWYKKDCLIELFVVGCTARTVSVSDWVGTSEKYSQFVFSSFLATDLSE